MCPYCLSRLSTTLLIVQSPIPLQGVFNALIFKGKSVRFQQRMKGLFAKCALFKVLLKVQGSKLFICILSSQAFELGWIWEGGGGVVSEGGWNFESLGDEVDHKNLIEGRSVFEFHVRLQYPKSGLENQNLDFPIEHNPRVCPWRSNIADCWWRWSIFFPDQMGPADVSRLQQPGFWTYYLWHCKCCMYCYCIQAPDWTR